MKGTEVWATVGRAILCSPRIPRAWRVSPRPQGEKLLCRREMGADVTRAQAVAWCCAFRRNSAGALMQAASKAALREAGTWVPRDRIGVLPGSQPLGLEERPRLQELWVPPAPAWAQQPLIAPCVPAGPAGDAPVRITRLGWVRGKQATVLGSSMPVNVFLGVPFAAPPLGPLRFANPKPAMPWSDFRNATSYPNL